MKISDLLGKGQPTLSFEVFPPKTSDGYSSVEQAARKIASLRPDFMSVTYGAGGGTSEFTLRLSREIQTQNEVPVLSHLTCVSSTKETVRERIRDYKENGIENIMALRGDIPEGGRIADDFHYASELIREVRELYPECCIGGACYPDGHPESANKKEDILHLREKTDAGLSFLTTQMFFDNNVLYNFLYRIREAGIRVPVVAGIMPITNAKQIRRTLALSGTVLPDHFKAILDRFSDTPAAMMQAGIIYASEQIIDLLANGVDHIHVYSMNKPEVAAGICTLLSAVMKA